MNLYTHALYAEDLRYVSELPLDWDALRGSRVLISGATGLIGSFLVDVLMTRNASGLNCTIYALSRDAERAARRFAHWRGDERLRFVPYDVSRPIEAGAVDGADYVLHLASNTHPVLYATDPIGTIVTNLFGLRNLLDFAVEAGARRFAFASSNEIYGENRGDVELFDEAYCGYIDSNTLRAGYPESKRCGEALCQAYMAQRGLDIVIPRLTRSYGPTMLMTDTKAVSQFIRKGLAGEDIVLKSDGSQFYSYTYVADAVAGLLYVLLKGQRGAAYNIADERSDIRLRDLAAVIAELSGRRVVFELPDAVESAGYSRATKARLDGSRLKGLGWWARYDIRGGMARTLAILRG